jgi:CheY-like chemotaxis protein
MKTHPQWALAGTAQSVGQAKALIDARRPQLIFCDWDIVGGSGFEVLQHIGQQSDYHPFIIFNTGFQADHPEIAEELINTYKVDAFINKPYWEKLKSQLPELVAQALEKAKGGPFENGSYFWLRLYNGGKVRTNLKHLTAIVQCPHNARNKRVYLHNLSEPYTVTLTWTEASLLFAKGNQHAFPVNKRYALIGKDYVVKYQRPYVWVGEPPLKIEVVRENQKDFEAWIGVR